MSVFDILTMIGGLALFLYGMEVMGNGLSKASGGRMERILEKMTDNIFKAVLLGAGPVDLQFMTGFCHGKDQIACITVDFNG